MKSCGTAPNCSLSNSILTAIKNTLCTWYKEFKARFITGVLNHESIGVGSAGKVVATKACRIEDYSFFNSSVAPIYLRLYNIGDRLPLPSDTPLRRFLVPAQSGENVTDLNLPFDAGLSYRCTAGVTDADETAPAANALLVNIGYKFL